MTNKWTPGPWWTDDEFVLAPGKCIADTTPHPDDNMSDEEAEANAHLIAAAPKLFKAVEACLLREDIANSELGDQLRAVLAEAKGE